MSGIVVYDITSPTAPSFVQYIDNRDFTADPETAAAGDLGPEGLVFVPAVQSPSGVPLLIVANEVSGTVTIYEITVPAVEARLDEVLSVMVERLARSFRFDPTTLAPLVEAVAEKLARFYPLVAEHSADGSWREAETGWSRGVDQSTDGLPSWLVYSRSPLGRAVRDSLIEAWDPFEAELG
jgi:hypothetical protein